MVKRSSSQQKAFRNRLFERQNKVFGGSTYATTTASSRTIHIHCEICATRCPQTDLEAAHIIPLATAVMDRNYLNSSENGLLLCIQCHILLDAHKIYFDPCTGVINKGHRATETTCTRAHRSQMASLVSVKPFFAYWVGIPGWPTVASLAIAAGLSRQPP
jgi:ferredoxin